jgi:hypothetical protein
MLRLKLHHNVEIRLITAFRTVWERSVPHLGAPEKPQFV